MEKSQHTDFNEDKTNVVMYGSESWTLGKNEETRLEAFEMKGLRKIFACFVDSKEKMSGFSTKLE